MQDIVRLEIIVDSVATEEVLSIIEPHPDITCSVHRALACQCGGKIVTQDDLSDSLSYHLLILFVPQKTLPKIQKLLMKSLEGYTSSIFQVQCTQVD